MGVVEVEWGVDETEGAWVGPRVARGQEGGKWGLSEKPGVVTKMGDALPGTGC